MKKELEKNIEKESKALAELVFHVFDIGNKYKLTPIQLIGILNTIAVAISKLIFKEKAVTVFFVKEEGGVAK